MLVYTSLADSGTVVLPWSCGLCAASQKQSHNLAERGYIYLDAGWVSSYLTPPWFECSWCRTLAPAPKSRPAAEHGHQNSALLLTSLACVSLPPSLVPSAGQLGLNLADNGVTDRGAALLSVCLQHNATLCALVLDGNPDIGRDAERRITEELETRSVMPEVDMLVSCRSAAWSVCAVLT